MSEKYKITHPNGHWFIAIFFIFIVSNHGFSQSAKEIKAELQGEWISLKDSNSLLIIIGDTLYEKSIDGRTFGVCTLSFSKGNCGQQYKSIIDSDEYFIFRKNKKTDLFLIEHHIKNGDIYCYRIDYLSNSALRMTFEGGNVLEYVKKE